MDDLKIEYLGLDELKPYEKNARKHEKEDVATIEASIREFGFCDAIGIWGKDNVIVEGHGRYKACKNLGIDRVPCVRLDHLTDEQRRAYALAHNKTAEMSDWSIDLLNLELDDIADIDMEQFGFELSVDEEETPTIEEDEIDEEVPPIAEMGDIYILGRHKLMCGDSTDTLQVQKLVGGVDIDVIYTDPPYGMNLNTDFSSMKNKFKGEGHGKKYDQGKVDEFHPEMIDTVFTVPAKEVFLWGADYFAELLPDKNEGSWIVWDKRANGNGDEKEDESSDRMYGSCFELCWSKKRHKRDIARVKWAGLFGTESEFDHKRYHPTQKPTKLTAWFLERYSKENDNILDLFGGSGSTLIGCEQLGRTCYTMEYDTHYVDVIVNRYIALKKSDEGIKVIRNGVEMPYSELKG